MMIRTRPGAWIASVNTTEVATLQTQIITDAIIHMDEETGDHVFEFIYNGRQWTVGHESVELIDIKESRPCQN